MMADRACQDGTLSVIRRLSWRILRGGLIALLVVELTSFIAVSMINHVMTGRGARDFRSLVDYSPFTVFHQSAGVRPTVTVGDPPPPGDANRIVWMFGGSTVRCDGPDASLTLPSLVLRDLQVGEEGDRWVMRNFGENAFNSLQEVNYLWELLLTREERPDVAVFYDGANDTSLFALYRQPDAHYGYDKVKTLVESYPRSYFVILKPIKAAVLSSFTRDLLIRARYYMLPAKPNDEAVRRFAASYARRYESLTDILRANGIRLVVIWQPFLWVQDRAVPADDEVWRVINGKKAAPIRDSYRAINGAIRAQMEGKPFFHDLHTALEDGQAASMYEWDGVHLTTEGRRAIAGKIAAVLQESVRSRGD
jgi:lysophospholipase L1-like esterase